MRVQATDSRVIQPPLADVLAPAAPRTVGRAAPAGDVVVDIGVPSTPPEAVRAQVQEAAQVAARMALDNRELHFEKDERSGRIIVQVRDLRGTVIRTIPPSSALELLTGGGGA